MSYRPYPEYKDSGVEWLGEVPAHWGVHTGKRLFAERRVPARADDVQLSVTQRHGIVPQSIYMETQQQGVVLALSGTGGFKRVEKGNFVISLRSFQGGIEWSGYSGCVSPAYTVLTPSARIIGRLWSYLLKSSGYISALQTVTEGIRDGKNISYAQFGGLEVPLPPVHEQTIIARYLDEATARIDTLVEKKTRFIELLREKRQALITHAVTKGLDPDVPMKDSGVEWLGQVPAHWSLPSLKRLTHLGNGSTPSRDNPGYWVNGTFPWLTSTCVNLDTVKAGREFVTSRALSECHLPIIEPPAVLVGITGQGKTRGMVTMLDVRATINQHLVFVKPSDTSLDPAYLLYVLSAAYGWLRSESEGSGSTRAAIAIDKLANMKIPLPESEVQAAIVRFLCGATDRIDTLISKTEHSIALLREKRSALITAAVTGKIDLRDSAAA